MRGFGVAMSHIVFFVATLVAVSIAVSAITAALKGLSYAMQEKAKVSANQAATLIKIVDGGYSIETNALWVYVKNIGKTTLDINSIDVFLNGTYIGSCNASVKCLDEDGDGYLLENELMDVNFSYPLSSGSYRIRIVTQYGVYADYEVVVG